MGWKIYFSHGEFNDKGIAIMIPKSIKDNFELNKVYIDNEGLQDRLIFIKCKIDNNHYRYTIINVYCQIKDNVKGQNYFLTVLP